MSSLDRAHVIDTAIFEDMRSALIRFTPRALDALNAVEREIRMTYDWLADRRSHWRRQISIQEDAVIRARRALEDCQSDRRNGSRGCRDAIEHLEDARRKLDRAKANARAVKHWQAEFERAVEQYKRKARRFRELIDSTSMRAQVYLHDQQESLDAYLAVPIIYETFGTFGPSFPKAIQGYYKHLRNQIGGDAVRMAKKDEIELVKKTGKGTRDWSKSEVNQLKKGAFPSGYQGHHVNNVARFPDLAGNPDNIVFVTKEEHFKLHQGNWRNNTSGKQFNRKSLMVQWQARKVSTEDN